MEMEGMSLFQTLKNYLFSNINKQFLIFLFFLILSASFWLFMTLNDTYEQEIKVPVEIVNVPKNVVMTSTAVDTIRITVRDRGWEIFSYLYGDKISTMRMTFKNYDRGEGEGVIPNAELKRYAKQLLESSSKLISIKPEKLDFFYNNGERKRVPVRYVGRVMPEQIYFISHIEYTPDSVDVYASPEKLDSIRIILTEPLNHVGFRDTLFVNCRLTHPSDVKVVPDQIRIGFFTDVLTEESISVPIKCINLPEGKVLRTFPAKVKVNFVAGVSELRNLRPEDFSVVADYLEIQQKPSDKCNLYLRSVPRGISRATLETKKVDYLIEEE
jgi:hypothetical protein